MPLGPLAAGQSSLLVTPLQLALEAAAVANNGWIQMPRVTDPGPLGKWPVMSAKTAHAAHPTVAIAVVVTDPNGGYGATVAAPIAARVLRDVLPKPR